MKLSSLTLLRKQNQLFIVGLFALAIVGILRFASENVHWDVRPKIEYFYIDRTGAPVLRGQGFYGDSFKCGLALICDKYADGSENKLFRFIDKQGREKFRIFAREAHSFSEGLAAVRVSTPTHKTGLFGFLDETGKWKIEPKFYRADSFSEGRALTVGVDYSVSYIDRSGQSVLDLTAQLGAKSDHGYSKELFCPYSEGLAAGKMDGTWGYLDKKASWAIKQQWRRETMSPFSPFCEGLCAITENGGNCYFIDKSGNRIFEHRFQGVGDFSEGLAPICINSHWGFVDRTGKVVIEPRFESTSVFSEGFASVILNGKTGYINHRGELVISPQYALGGDFSNGVALVVPFISHKSEQLTPGLLMWGKPSGKYFAKRPNTWIFPEDSK